MFRQTVLVYHCGELTVAREFDGTSRILADSSEHVSLAFKFPNTPFVFMFFQRFSTNGPNPPPVGSQCGKHGQGQQGEGEEEEVLQGGGNSGRDFGHDVRPQRDGLCE